MKSRVGLWAALRTPPLDQQVSISPHLRTTLPPSELVNEPVAQFCSTSRIGSAVSPDLVLEPGGTTPVFLLCYQPIVSCKNNNPPLSQKNNVSSHRCN